MIMKLMGCGCPRKNRGGWIQFIVSNFNKYSFVILLNWIIISVHKLKYTQGFKNKRKRWNWMHGSFILHEWSFKVSFYPSPYLNVCMFTEATTPMVNDPGTHCFLKGKGGGGWGILGLHVRGRGLTISNFFQNNKFFTHPTKKWNKQEAMKYTIA